MNNRDNNKYLIKKLTLSAALASVYVLLTYVSFLFGMSSGVIQCRLGEALCILSAYTPAAIPGITVGCVLANLLTGANILDIIFGSAATLIGLLLAGMLEKLPYLSSIPTVISNTVIVTPLLIYLYGAEQAWYIVALFVFIGEVISCGVFGTCMVLWLEKSQSGIKMKKILKNMSFREKSS